MMILAEAYGADFRLVAFMQYLRVVMVAVVASVIALLFVHTGGGRFSTGLLPPVHWAAFAATLAIGVVGAGVATIARLPAAALIGPFVLGTILQTCGLVTIELPPLLLIASYAVIGWNTGLRFTREVLRAAWRALPQCLAATLALMACCGLLAWVLVLTMRVDPLTAYLATSPGGVDAAVIIATGTKVDTSFIMALQIARVILLLVVGPTLARIVANTLPGADEGDAR